MKKADYEKYESLVQEYRTKYPKAADKNFINTLKIVKLVNTTSEVIDNITSRFPKHNTAFLINDISSSLNLLSYYTLQNLTQETLQECQFLMSVASHLPTIMQKVETAESPLK